MLHLAHTWFSLLYQIFSWIVLGMIAGVLLSRRVAGIEAARVARGYYAGIAAVVGLDAIVYIYGVIQGFGPAWSRANGDLGILESILFGLVIGLSLRRKDRWEILREPQIFSAGCLSTGLGFVIAGFSKALYMQGITEFFNQSGYSTSFLKFIMTIEVLAGLGLMLPWAAPLVIAGLSVDMFGAIYTHVHNGDPLLDSLGAIAQLIGFAILMTLWALQRRPATVHGSPRKRFAAIATVGALSAIVAVVGGSLVRRYSPPVRSSQTQSSQTQSSQTQSSLPRSTS